MYQTTETGSAYEQEIDLKDLMFAVLYRWRPIILAAVALALLLGGWRAFSVYRNQSTGDAAQKAYEEYERAVQVYEQSQESLQRELDSLMERITEQQEYLEKSVLMNISPYNIWEAENLLFLDSGYRIMPGMTYQGPDYTDTLLRAYRAALTNMSFMSGVAEQTGIGERYLMELVTLTTENRLLSIRVRSGDKETTESIMNELMKGVREAQKELRSSIGEHTIKEVSGSCGTLIDLALLDTQKAQNDQLVTLNDRLTAKQDELDNMEEPKAPAASVIGAIKSGIKYAVLGGVLGAFVVVFLVCVVFLMSDKLYLGKGLKERFRIPVLGAIPAAGRKRKGVDGLLARLEGRAADDGSGREGVYDLIAAGISSCVDASSVLLVAGTALAEEIEETAEELSEKIPDCQVIAGGNLLKSAEMLRKLQECGVVVFVERCGHSTYGDVEQELERAAGLKKQVAGFVVFE